MDKINLGNGTVGSGDSAVVGGGKINDNFIAVVLSLNGDTIWDGETSSVIDLSGLNTDDKSDLVAAINSILASKGVANGIASLDGSGLVPSTQLPSYVDDVQEYPTFNDFPVTGETGVIYIALDTNYTYRWSGSTYIQLTDQTAIWGQINGDISNQTDIQPYIVTIVDKAFVDALGVDANTLDGLDSSAFYLSSNPNGYIDASNVVFDNTIQTITGAKTFTILLTANGGITIPTTETIQVGGSAGITSDGYIHLHRYGNNTKTVVGNNGTNVDFEVPNGTATFGGLLTANEGAVISGGAFTYTGESDVTTIKSDNDAPLRVEGTNDVWSGIGFIGASGNAGNIFYNSVSEYFQVTKELRVLSGIDASGQTVTAGDFRVDNLNTAPSSATDTGTTGEIRFTSDYIYMCVATNTWKRSPLSTW